MPASLKVRDALEDARGPRFVDAVIEVVAHQDDAPVDAPARGVGAQIGELHFIQSSTMYWSC